MVMVPCGVNGVGDGVRVGEGVGEAVGDGNGLGVGVVELIGSGAMLGDGEKEGEGVGVGSTVGSRGNAVGEGSLGVGSSRSIIPSPSVSSGWPWVVSMISTGIATQEKVMSV